MMGVQCPEYIINQLAHSDEDGALGKLILDKIFYESDNLNMDIIGQIHQCFHVKNHFQNQNRKNLQIRPIQISRMWQLQL